MNNEDIMRMAQEAEVKPMLYDGKWAIVNLDRFFHMAQAAERNRIADESKHIIKRAEARGAAAEREACAQIADSYAEGLSRNYSEIIADTIRARGQA